MTKKKWILVVDDDPSVLRLITTMFQDEYRFRAATNVELAIRLLAEYPEPALVLTDIFMPGRIGTELIRHVREQYPDIPIIAMSAGAKDWTPPEILTLASDIGSHNILPKPFGYYDLSTKIKNLIE